MKLKKNCGFKLQLVASIERAFVEKLIIVPRVPWRSWRIFLKLLDEVRDFGILQPFLASSL
jgi:hypothetical protein